MTDERAFRITVLAPVHIGSGRVLSRNIDILSHQGQTYFFDLEDLLHRTKNAEALLGCLRVQVAQGSSRPAMPTVRADELFAILRRAGVRPEEISRLRPLRNRFRARDLRLFIQTADERPYIPGSSLKGALRTLILQGLARRWESHGTLDVSLTEKARRALATTLSNLGSERQAAASFEAELLRPSLNGPHGDLLRALRTTDAFFSREDLSVEQVRVHSGAGPHGFKTFWLAAECLKAGSSSPVRLALYDELLRGPWARAIGFDSHPLSWENLSAWSVALAGEVLQQEMERFNRRGLPQVADSLKQIFPTLRKSEGGGAIYLRLGWGISWEGTTGGLASPDDRRQLIRRFGNMARNHRAEDYPDDDPFPRSRRVRMTSDEQAIGVYGWIRLDPI